MKGVREITKRGAKFMDGQEKEFDSIILATGYKSNVPSWLKVTTSPNILRNLSTLYVWIILKNIILFCWDFDDVYLSHNIFSMFVLFNLSLHFAKALPTSSFF